MCARTHSDTRSPAPVKLESPLLHTTRGWNIEENGAFLEKIITDIKNEGIRTSLFMETDLKQLALLPSIGADRVELYTGPYAENFHSDRHNAVKSYAEASKKIQELGLGLNAGHDLNLDNLTFFNQNVEGLLEVSIGHALISDALYFGIENTIQLYKKRLQE